MIQGLESLRVVGKVKLETNITVQMIQDILENAVLASEWIDRIVMSAPDFKGTLGEYVSAGRIGLIYSVDDRATALQVSCEKIVAAIQSYCEESGEGVYDLVENLDGTSADVILQLALFNEVVYG